ncbi:MAG: TonB-dependent receptor [Bacteroidota bacterium]
MKASSVISIAKGIFTCDYRAERRRVRIQDPWSHVPVIVSIAWMILLAGVPHKVAAQTDQGGQESGWTGIVVDQESGQPIPGATLQWTDNGKGVASDESGRFRLESRTLQESPELQVRAIGYQSREVTLPETGTKSIRLELTPEVLQGEEVIITRSPVGSTVRTQPAEAYNREQLQRRAAPSLGEMLQGSAGVSSRSFGSAPSRPVVRGMDGDRLLVIQNGERMGDLSSTAVDHAVAMEPLVMDRVEIVRGPASLLYGSSAIGGVVQLFSRDLPTEWDSGWSGTAAMHGASVNRMGSGMIRMQQGSDRWALTGRLSYRNGADLQTPEGRLPDTFIESQNAAFGAGWRTGSVENGIAADQIRMDYGLPESVDDDSQSIRIDMERSHLQGRSVWTPDRWIEQMEFRLHYSDYQHLEVEENRGGTTTNEVVGIRFDQQSVNGSLLMRHRPSGPLEGAIGVSLHHHAIQVGGVDALTPDGTGGALAAYVYEELNLGPEWTLTGGTRIEGRWTQALTNDRFSTVLNGDTRVEPILSGALGLEWTPSSAWSIGAQVARAYRTPTLEELYSDAPHAAAGSYDRGNPNLGNETSLGGDLHATYSGSTFRSDLSLFLNRLNGYVDFSPTGRTHESSGLPIFEYRAKEAILRGFEWQVELERPAGWRGSLVLDGVWGNEQSEARDPLSAMPPARLQLEWLLERETYWLGPRVLIGAAQNRVAPNEETTEGYWLLGWQSGWRIGPGGTLSLRVDNLLDRAWRDHLSRVEQRNAPMPGRSVNLMVRWEW